MRPHRREPTRLPRPWDSPGKNTGVGCHLLLQCMKVKSEVAQSCLTLHDSMDCSLPGASVHGIYTVLIRTVSVTILSIWHTLSHLIIITTQKLVTIAVPILKIFTTFTKYFQPVKLSWVLTSRVIYQRTISHAWSVHMTELNYSVSKPSRDETDTEPWPRALGKQKQTTTINFH